MEVQPPLVFSGAYSDKRQKHQQIFFSSFKKMIYFFKSKVLSNFSALPKYFIFLLVNYFAKYAFKNPF